MLKLNATEKTIVDALKVNYITRENDCYDNWAGVYFFKNKPSSDFDDYPWHVLYEDPTYFDNKNLFNCIGCGECYKVLKDGSLFLVGKTD